MNICVEELQRAKASLGAGASVDEAKQKRKKRSLLA
jgi:hypothetical protein